MYKSFLARDHRILNSIFNTPKVSFQYFSIESLRFGSWFKDKDCVVEIILT